MANDDEFEGSVVLRGERQVVGVTRGRRKEKPVKRKFSTAVRGDKEVTPQTIRKASEALITADGHTLTEDEANVKALELISDAAARLDKNSRIVRKQKSSFSIGAALAAQLEKLKNRGNG